MPMLNIPTDNPEEINCTDQDSILLLRMFRSFAEGNISAFETAFPEFAQLAKSQQDALFNNLDDPQVCGIVVTGAD